jgi:hypothetical protein
MVSIMPQQQDSLGHSPRFSLDRKLELLGLEL